MNFEYLARLNEPQLEAATHHVGPMVVLAGAGSGKTATMISRIQHLITHHHVPAHRILGITFTNKAAMEMKERAVSVVGDDAKGIHLSTFHSLCVRILREYASRHPQSRERSEDEFGYTGNFTIMDSRDQRGVIKAAMLAADVDPDEYEPSMFSTYISSFKNLLISPEWAQYATQFINNHSRKVPEFPPYIDVDETISAVSRIPLEILHQVIEVYTIYQTKLRLSNNMDFDDLIMLTIEMLLSDTSVLAIFQNKFEFIMVDEYQDSNHAQYILIRLLAAKHQNLFVVGDDFQCIYGFRNADIRKILNFMKDYPNAKKVMLERNYRSTKNIIDLANKVISNNPDQYKKTLWTDKESSFKTPYVVLADEKGEADWIADKIVELVSQGVYDYSDFAIIYRLNALSLAVEIAFSKAKIPYTLVGNVSFYDRKEIKDVTAYLKILVNETDEISLKRVLNVPKRGIGDVTVKRIENYAEENGISFWKALNEADFFLKPKPASAVAEFCDIVHKLRESMETQGVGMIIDDLYDLTGMMRLAQEADEIHSTFRAENLQTLFNRAWEHQQEVAPDVASFLEVITMHSSQENSGDEGGVQLLTIHASKGLEFPVVFGISMEEGILPSGRSIESDNVDEERRLCYVLVTRAKERLYLTRAELRMLYGMTTTTRPSRFLEEMGFNPSQVALEHKLPW